MTLRIAILISGRGSNMRALVDACLKGDVAAEVACVVSNEPEAAGLDFVREAGLRAIVIDHRDFTSRAAFEDTLDETLKEAGAELICLAGFMRLLGPDFVGRWRDRIINVHPSLLPAYKGLRVHERVIEEGVRFSGCTVHYVRPEMDSGPVILQAVVPVAEDDTPETLAARVLAEEHRIYPMALRCIAEGRVRVDGDRVKITGARMSPASLVNPEI